MASKKTTMVGSVLTQLDQNQGTAQKSEGTNDQTSHSQEFSRHTPL
jgi:hypothetical protein